MSGAVPIDDSAHWDIKAHAEDENLSYRTRLQLLLLDLWLDEVLSEQQCAKYHGVALVSMRRIFDCEAARRGYADRQAAQCGHNPYSPAGHVASCGCPVCDQKRNQGVFPR